MFIQISKSERLDIFLALASFYKFEPEGSGEAGSDKSQLSLALEALSSLDKNELAELKSRAKRFESLSIEKQQNWQTFWLEKLRQHGQTLRLDEHIHIENVAAVISDEPKVIQQLIYENLPNEKAKKLVEFYSDIGKTNDYSIGTPVDELANIVRDKFLSYFVAFEDIYQAKTIDEFSLEKLNDFIWSLGIREVAISCRGIKTKENLAVFLKPFDDVLTKEIALKITDVETINPKRVIFAEKLVSKVFQNEIEPNEWIKYLGLQLVALTFALRDEIPQRFTRQKFPIEMGDKFNEYIKEHKLKKTNEIKKVIAETIKLSNEFQG